MLLLAILICLLVGPNAKWVKRFLPNNANRIVFVTAITGLVIAWLIQGIGNITHGDRGEGYFTLTLSALSCRALSLR